MYNLQTNVLVQKALAAATITTGTTKGITVDTAVFGNNFRDVLFIVTSGALTDGTYAFTAQQSDTTTDGDFAAVPASRILGALPTLDSAADDNVVRSFGVRPSKRYVRIVCTAASASTGGALSATATLAAGSNHPVTTS